MRSWGNRPDTFVCDEPLYGYYLKQTGVKHPGADEVIRAMECDWRKVTAWLTGPVPEGKQIFYQKQMTHHLLPEVGRDWLGQLTNIFLIREPREVAPSFIKVAGEPRLEDIGFPQQRDVFEWVRRHTGRVPIVIDSRDVLEDPSRMLRLLCEAIGVPFTEAMLSWPPGPRKTDGVWAKYWYESVLQSTSFQPYRPKNETIPANLTGLLERADEIYQSLYVHRLGR
jgi:hypothetical protein